MQSNSGQAPKDMKEIQNRIQDKFYFLKSHIRHKGLSKSSGFQSLSRGASASIALAHNIFNQHGQYGDQHPIRHHNTALSYKPQCSFCAFFGGPAGHGPVHTDKNHAIIIPQAKAGDNKNSLLHLPGIGGGNLRR